MVEAQPRVLFVDDEPGILKSLRRLFVDEDWEIFLAESAAEGLDILAQHSIALVVSDVRMPEMDGIQFLFLEKERFPAVSRIFLSGHAEKESITVALSEGCAQQRLPKPSNYDELREVVKNILEERKLPPADPDYAPHLSKLFKIEAHDLELLEQNLNSALDTCVN